jgi:hypothetical protein
VTPKITMSQTLLITDAGHLVTAVPLKYKSTGGQPLAYDLPDVPELDGQLVPDELPTDSAVCHDWFGM